MQFETYKKYTEDNPQKIAGNNKIKNRSTITIRSKNIHFREDHSIAINPNINYYGK
ncbi:hypothetical protein [Brevibacillus laterosporus]|uniref:hypothetical protein n=1 Tax=Brevibacillus laterosporus TaxID=1465 RepID=UPI0014444F6A|nr:hypothetical protein [Brevibacillus laterosporus]NKQ19741.1 hypothetical protein [Brevibacillus laterosporus]WNX30881.1 hypothetical protein RWW94_22285 [Brevibacillus laterosporus]